MATVTRWRPVGIQAGQVWAVQAVFPYPVAAGVLEIVRPAGTGWVRLARANAVLTGGNTLTFTLPAAVTLTLPVGEARVEVWVTPVSRPRFLLRRAPIEILPRVAELPGTPGTPPDPPTGAPVVSEDLVVSDDLVSSE